MTAQQIIENKVKRLVLKCLIRKKTSTVARVEVASKINFGFSKNWPENINVRPCAQKTARIRAMSFKPKETLEIIRIKAITVVRKRMERGTNFRILKSRSSGAYGSAF